MGKSSPFFIVGNSRSGTTLVARILKMHQDIHVLNETHFMEELGYEREHFPQLADKTLYRLVNTMLTIQRKDYYRKSEYQEYPEDAREVIAIFQRNDKKDFSAFIKAFFQFEARKYGKTLAGDQTPRFVFYIEKLSTMFPNAKFIEMIRDPRAVLLSQKHKWKASSRWNQPRFEILRTFINYHPITTALIWRKAINAGFWAKKILHSRSLITIPFETITSNPETAVKNLCTFLDVKYAPEMLEVGVEFSATASEEGTPGISKEVAGTWRKKLSQTEVFIAETIAKTEMQRLDYVMTAARPNPFMLLLYIVLWPFQISAAFVLNIGRMKKPVAFLSNILRTNKRAI